MKFKVGDKVVCVNCGDNHRIHNGGIYIISRLGVDNFLVLEGVNNALGYNPVRFELAISEINNNKLLKALDLSQDEPAPKVD